MERRPTGRRSFFLEPRARGRGSGSRSQERSGFRSPPAVPTNGFRAPFEPRWSRSAGGAGASSDPVRFRAPPIEALVEAAVEVLGPLVGAFSPDEVGASQE